MDIRQCTGVKYLELRDPDLTECMISNDGLRHVTALSKLRELRILSCKGIDDQSMEIFGRLEGLEVLRIGNSFGNRRITDNGINNIRQLRHLAVIDLSGAPVQFNNLFDIISSSNIQSVSLSDTRVSQGSFSGLAKMANLRALDLSRNRLNEDHFIWIANQPKLVSLNLDEVGAKDNVLKHLANLPNLECLSIRYNDLTDKAGAIIAGMRNLRSLAIDGNDILDEGIVQIGLAPNLTELVLGNTVTGRGLSAIAYPNRIIRLTLYGNKNISDEDIDCLSRFSSLKWLNIRNTSITPSGVKKLDGMLTHAHSISY